MKAIKALKTSDSPLQLAQAPHYNANPIPPDAIHETERVVSLGIQNLVQCIEDMLFSHRTPARRLPSLLSKT